MYTHAPWHRPPWSARDCILLAPGCRQPRWRKRPSNEPIACGDSGPATATRSSAFRATGDVRLAGCGRVAVWSRPGVRAAVPAAAGTGLATEPLSALRPGPPSRRAPQRQRDPPALCLARTSRGRVSFFHQPVPQKLHGHVGPPGVRRAQIVAQGHL
ncbi:hypothetical protein BDY21DRAFT_407597, partial [Lineolata rhizophorae]